MEEVQLCKTFRVFDKEIAMRNNTDQQKAQGLLHQVFYI